MSLASVLLLHAFDAALRWDALLLEIQRRRLVREREDRRARLWDAVERGDEW